MKFGKRLSNQIEETLPEWRDKFLSYKELKKQLKLIEPKATAAEANGEVVRPTKRARFENGESGVESGKPATVSVAEGMSEAEEDFVKLLEDEIEKFNSFFVEKEEEYIIRLKELQDRVAKSIGCSNVLIRIRKEIVDFHGEMVLLENYSALNYTGLVKILKKYDKRTGALLRLPFIQKVLQEPFFTTDLLYKLVKECERMLDHLFPVIEAPPATEASADEPSTSDSNKNDGLLSGPNELAEIEYMESLYMKSTISALRSLKEIRSGSSTVSAFSLPPLQINALDETWKKIPILEQVAK